MHEIFMAPNVFEGTSVLFVLSKPLSNILDGIKSNISHWFPFSDIEKKKCQWHFFMRAIMSTIDRSWYLLPINIWIDITYGCMYIGFSFIKKRIKGNAHFQMSYRLISRISENHILISIKVKTVLWYIYTSPLLNVTHYYLYYI